MEEEVLREDRTRSHVKNMRSDNESVREVWDKKVWSADGKRVRCENRKMGAPRGGVETKRSHTVVSVYASGLWV